MQMKKYVQEFLFADTSIPLTFASTALIGWRQECMVH